MTAMPRALVACALLWATPGHADVVSSVHELALRHAGPSASNATIRAMAIVSVAMFDAANAIERRFEPYLPQAAPPANADAEAAALGAGCAAILLLQPAQQAEIIARTEESIS